MKSAQGARVQVSGLAVILAVPQGIAGQPQGSAVEGWLWLSLFALIGLAVYTVDCWIHPFTSCGKCKGKGRFRSPLSKKRWRPCRKCGGSGTRLHPMRKVLNVLGGKKK